MKLRESSLFMASALVLSCTFISAPARGQEEATACFGFDLQELKEAVRREPKNLGLRMRLAQGLLASVRTADVRATRGLLEQVESEMRTLLELKPGFVYPYRVLAKIHYQRREFGKTIELIDSFAEVGRPDYELRTLYFKSLLHNAGEEKGAAQKATREKAASYVGSWFDSGEAPPFGTTLGAMNVWLLDSEFRESLLVDFKNRYESNPRNLNLLISYASALSVLGRNESAWRIVHEAEKVGLCDAATGGRHPIATLLGWACPEEVRPGSYEGLDLDELRQRAKEDPEDASLRFRVAILLKNRAQLLSVRAQRADRLIARERKKNPRADVSKYLSDKSRYESEANALFEEAIPHAKKVRSLNPSIESVPLLLGDIAYKLGRLDEAAQYLSEGAALVPFFPDLRDVLALVYKEKKDYRNAAKQLVEVCKSVGCRADEWDQEAPDSILPVPRVPREQMLVELIETPGARDVVISEFNSAAKADPKNPNLQTFLAMLNYFAGNKREAIRWMREAERNGMAGTEGSEHFLATLIAIRDRW